MATPKHKSVSPFENGLIIGGNLVVLLGVMLWDWSLFDIFYIYWLENVLIGLVTAMRMLMVSAAWGIGMVIGTLFSVAFFTVHYGMFCFGHGMILFDLFYKGTIDFNSEPILMFNYALNDTSQGMFYAIVGMVIVEIIRFIQQRAEDKRDAAIPQAIMFSPYGRIVILHVTIIMGGLGAQALGDPIWALLLLVILKTTYDLGAHNYTFGPKLSDEQKAAALKERKLLQGLFSGKRSNDNE